MYQKITLQLLFDIVAKVAFLLQIPDVNNPVQIPLTNYLNKFKQGCIIQDKKIVLLLCHSHVARG